MATLEPSSTAVVDNKNSLEPPSTAVINAENSLEPQSMASVDDTNSLVPSSTSAIDDKDLLEKLSTTTVDDNDSQEPPSTTTAVDGDKSSLSNTTLSSDVNNEASSKRQPTSVMSRLRSQLKKALPSPPKMNFKLPKRKQAPQDQEKLTPVEPPSTAAMDNKESLEPPSTATVDEDKISVSNASQLNSDDNEASSKPKPNRVLSMLRCQLQKAFPERKQASLEQEKLPPMAANTVAKEEEEQMMTRGQSPTSSNLTKCTTSCSFPNPSKMNFKLPKRKQASPEQETSQCPITSSDSTICTTTSCLFPDPSKRKQASQKEKLPPMAENTEAKEEEATMPQSQSTTSSNSTKCMTMPSCLLPIKSILAPKRKSSKLALPSSDSKDQAIQITPSDKTLSMEDKYQIVRSVGDECIQEEELQSLLINNHHPICYDRLEPSGQMHIAQGIIKTMNVNKLTSAGCRVKILIEDQFAKMNDKLGGDMEKIETVGSYMIEVWKAMGMNLEDGNVEFLWWSKEIKGREFEYLNLMGDIGKRFSAARITRCCPVMGGNDDDNVAQLLCPIRQCADIFFQQADICQMGMDRRNFNMLAREYCDHIKRKNKPIILSHHMLPGLCEEENMTSESDLESAIFMTDSEDEVRRKISKALCPKKDEGNPSLCPETTKAPGKVRVNPCLEYMKYLIFPWFNEFVVENIDQHGGDKTFISYEELVAHYESGEVNPEDLKNALSKAINKILQPVREHFEKDETAKQLLQTVQSYEVTR